MCSSGSTFRRWLLLRRHSQEWRFLYSLNPMVGVIDGFRWCLLGGESRLHLPGFAMSLVVVALFLFSGVVFPPDREDFRGSTVT